jgi:imidazolonepropionase-like amidohydrolase
MRESLQDERYSYLVDFHIHRLRFETLMIHALRGKCGLVPVLLAAMLCACSTQPPERLGPGADLVITNVRIIAGPDAPVLENASILVRGDRIDRVEPGSASGFGPDIAVIDGGGATALAGFWNMHVHLVTPVFLDADGFDDPTLEAELKRAFTQWGFTTVFDLASTVETASQLRRRIEDGPVSGPRILTVGAPFYPGGATPVYARRFYEAYGLPSAEVSSPAEAVQRVRAQYEAGANGVKLFTGAILSETEIAPMPLAIVTEVSEEADRLGIPVFAHPTDSVGLSLAVQGGVDILAHAAPLDGPWEPERARQIAEAGLALIPTLGLFEAHPHPSTPVELAVQQTRALHQAGGTILFGTDAGFTDQFDTSSEMRLMEEALGWRGVLAALTTAPAGAMGESFQRGQIAAGFIADIVLVRDDPASDIQALSRIDLVLRNGTIIYSASNRSGTQ